MRPKGIRAAALGAAVAAVGFFLPHTASAANHGVRVNGTPVSGMMAEVRDGQLMVAVRPYAAALGAGVEWDGDDLRVTVTRGGSETAFWLGSNTSFQDGRRLWAPVKPYLKNGQTMVPAWFLAVRFGGAVCYDGTTLDVSIQGGGTNGQGAAAPDHFLAQPSYYFPFATSAAYETYYDTMGDARYWQGEQFGHEGTDIPAPKGTPIVAVASGTVVRYGWNTLGGYRLNIQLDDFPGYRFYYAHMDGYAPGIGEGTHVVAGQVLGYVGSTGEGPEGTEGKFIDHLHFTIYGPDGEAINSYPFLKYWENHKVAW